MFPNLIRLLILLNIGIGSSNGFPFPGKWGKPQDELLGILQSQSKVNLVPGVPVEFASVGHNIFAVIPIPKSAYLMVQFKKTTKEVKKTKLAVLKSGSHIETAIDTVDEEPQRFESMSEAKEYAEFVWVMQLKEADLYFVSWSTTVPKGWTVVEWGEAQIVEDNPNGHTKHLAVILSASGMSTRSPLFCFAVCVEIGSTKSIIGFSQSSISLSVIRRALYEYNTSHYRFQTIARFAMLYSGLELIAREFIAELKMEIEETVKSFVASRVPGNAVWFESSLKIMEAWRTQKDVTLAILQLTITYSTEQHQVHEIVLYFFVRHRSVGVQSGRTWSLGPYENVMAFAILTLLDSLNPTHSTGFYTRVEMPTTVTGIIISIVDFIARRCASVTRGDQEETPLLNFLLQAAKRLMEEFGITDVSRIAALLLSGAILKGWVQLEEVKMYFGEEIYNHLCFPRSDVMNLTGAPVLLKDQARLIDLTSKINIEGKQETVYDLINRRISKKFARAQKAGSSAQPPKAIWIEFFATFILAGTPVHLYDVFKGNPKGKGKLEGEGPIFQFVIEWLSCVQESLLAEQFSGGFGRLALDKENEIALVRRTEQYGIIQTLELVARKSSARSLRSKNICRTPHINVSINITSIFLELRLTDRELLRAALAHGLLVNTEITFDQLGELLGTEVASIINRLHLYPDTDQAKSEPQKVECMRIILLNMAIMLYEMRQLTLHSLVPESIAKDKINANKNLLEKWSMWAQNSSKLVFATEKGLELARGYTELKKLLQEIMPNTLEHYSPPI